ncbi:hypothetical protein O6H91_20G074200 [Diphasiastrum complanatum]|uniref:Uncharacterized protein n=1 Tax=Diphasiastrum complanatum TaxID=34168 RepID=A0ACC2ARV1_DIPCM|nr:hypothetical protein O6H91_20G074200 [Diphasiastrum complanatum]
MGSLFIDVLVKSSHSRTQTLELVHKHVVSQIQNLCHSPKGCIGVVLVESILRPACVENLLLCKYRKEQAVLVETLKNELLAASISPSYVHPFRGIDDGEIKILGVGSSDLAVVLLGEKYTNEVLDRRLSELTKLDVVMDRQISNVDDNNLEVPTESIPPMASSFQSRLSNDHADIQEIKRLIKDEGKKTRDVVEVFGKKVVTEIKENRRLQIEFMENCLHKKLYTKLDRVINLSLQLQQRQVPCNFFFTTKDIGIQRRLIVKLLPSYSVVKLHLLCEHLDGIHIIKDQQGVEIFLANGQHAKHIRSLITIGLTIFSLLLKTGAHILAGIGDMIPNIGKGVALALDSQILSDYLPPSFSSTLRPLPVPTNMIEEARHNERNVAEQWLVNFLKGQNIWNSFSLTRVCYTKAGSVRWVCKDHREMGKCNGIMEDLPV